LKRTLMKTSFVLKSAATAVLLVSLAACGGGGSSSGGDSGGSGGVGAPSGASGTYVPAGNASTVEGVDSERRGYRDDVAQLIADKFSSVPEVKAAAVNAALSYQSSITAATLNSGDTTNTVKQDAISAWCAGIAAGPTHIDEVVAAVHAVYARTFNTDARMAARQQFIALSKPVGVLNFDNTSCTAQGSGQ
jgi:hypothetical protein